MKVVILENIRSAYNVGNIIRTADALWWDVRLAGYSPSPDDTVKVSKTSLGAEKNVWLKQFNTTIQAIEYAKTLWFVVIAAEVDQRSIYLKDFSKSTKKSDNIAVVFGNEIDGVLENTLKIVDNVVAIPMKWIKESLNVGQTSAIFMWELW